MTLFNSVIFGPIQSRRLGLSLGVNVMSPDAKLCNFDCIYCECGWNGDYRGGRFNSVDEIAAALESTLAAMPRQPDVITFAGNGEPTMHPDFPQIIDSTVEIRNRIAPNARIAVLSNATMIDRVEVRRALKRVDDNIQKLDSAIEDTYRRVNQPASARTVAQVVESLTLFEGDLTIQTMFLRGDGVDNTTEAEVGAWLAALRTIAPKRVMIYSLDRPTPQSGLARVSKEEMEAIARRVEELGIEVTVA